MSQRAGLLPRPRRGREAPRWSVPIGVPPSAPSLVQAPWTASTAGLPALSAWVLVSPPLSASGPSLTFETTWSVTPAEKHVPSSARFEPSESIVPAQLAPAEPVSRRVARRLTVPLERLKRPPAEEPAV